MASNTISQRISLEGGEDIKRQFTELARVGSQAFDQIRAAADRGGDIGRTLNTANAQRQLSDLVGAAQRLVGTFNQASAATDGLNDSARRATDGLTGTGSAVTRAGSAADSTSSRLATLGKGLAALAVLAVGVGTALFGIAKNSATAASGIKSAADGANATLGSFQQMKFAFEQMGLSSSDAEKAVGRLGAAALTTGTVMSERLRDVGFRFVQTEEGAQAVADTVEAIGRATLAINPQAIFQSETALAAVKREGGDAVKVFQDFQRAIANARTLADQRALAGVFLAGSQAAAALKRDSADAVQAFISFADALAKVKDPALQAQAANALFGKDLADQLLPSLKEGSAGLQQFLDDYKKLRLGITEDSADLAEKFENAMKRFTAASTQGRIELGARFLPVATQAVLAFTNLLRTNREPIQAWASNIATQVKSVISDIGLLIQGADETKIENTWMIKMRDAMVELGTAIKQITVSVIIPAWKSLKAIADEVAAGINRAFGTNISGTMVILGVVLLSLTGIFGGLALAALAFGGEAEAAAGGLTALGTQATRSSGLIRGTILPAIREFFTNLKNTSGSSNVFSRVMTGVVQFAKDLPRALLVAGGVLIAFGEALDTAAKKINALFGTKLTGTDLGVLLILGQMTRGLAAIASLATIAAAGVSIVFTTVLGLLGFLRLLPGPWLIVIGFAAAQVASFYVEANRIQKRLDDLRKEKGGVERPSDLIGIGDMTEQAAEADLIWQSIALAGKKAWELIAAGARASWNDIIAGARAFWNDITNLFNEAIAGLAANVWDPLVESAQTAWNKIVEGARTAAQAIGEALSRAGSFGLPSEFGGDSPGFAGGGSVRGPGGPRSDSILAWLSNGEFVIQAAAVKRYGVDFLAALNAMRLPRGLVAPGFSLGGLADGLSRALSVTMPIPRFADGGLALAAAGPSGRPVHLTIGDQTFRMTASDDVADRLVQAALTRQRRSAGRKPSSY